MVYNGVFGVLLVLALGLQGNSVSETNAASFMTSANLLRELVMTPEVSLCMAVSSPVKHSSHGVQQAFCRSVFSFLVYLSVLVCLCVCVEYLRWFPPLTASETFQGTSEQDLTAYFNVEAVVLNQCQRHKTPRDECNDRFWSRESVPQEMRDIHMAMRRCSKAEE